jgi:superfamily II DNA or RNA helicase
MELRPFQEDAIQQCREVLASGLKRVVLYAPTGAGKSVIAEALTNLSLGKGKRVAIIANRVQLVKQMAERFDASGIRYGILQGDNTANIHLPVVICSINTVEKRGLPDCDVIIIDEGHACAGSKMYRELIFQRNNVPVIALTATPFSKGMAKTYKELDGESLFQSMVIAETIKGLIGLGFLVDCEIYAPSEPDLTGVKLSRNSFGEYDYSDKSKEFAEAVDKPHLVGEIVTHWHRLAEGKPTICFATSIAHSNHIVNKFKSSGVLAEHIDCYMQEEEKEQILKRFKAGEFTVLSNCSLLAEGFDYPACEVMILARPTKSLIRYIQMVGRILRPFHGKDRGLLLDHSGSVHKLGFPTDDLPLFLNDGTPQVSEKKKPEEELPKKCSKCDFMKPPKVSVCPKCGHKAERQNEVVTVDGELKQIKAVDKYPKEEKLLFYAELHLYMRRKEFSIGWLNRTYNAKFGTFPVNDNPGIKIGGLRTYGENIHLKKWQELNIRKSTLDFIKHRNIAYAKSKHKISDKEQGLSRIQAMKAMLQGGANAPRP